MYVSNFSPNIGSVRGGTLVTINGDGFSTNCSLNKVTFGSSLDCKIVSCSNDYIQCKTSSAYSAYKIDNNGFNIGNNYTLLFVFQLMFILLI